VIQNNRLFVVMKISPAGQVFCRADSALEDRYHFFHFPPQLFPLAPSHGMSKAAYKLAVLPFVYHLRRLSE